MAQTNTSSVLWARSGSLRPVLYTAPRVQPDYPESRWVTNCHMDRPPDSTEWQLTQMGHKLSHGPSVGLRWTVPDWTLLESKMAVESREGGPVDSAGLCRTGVTKWQWSPERGVRWIPLDCAGLEWQNSSGVQRERGVWWSPPDCAELEWQNSSGVQRGGSGGFRQTVPDWSEKMAERGVHWIPSDCPGLDSSGVKNSSGVCI